MPPPQRRHRVRNTLLGVLGVLVIVIVVVVVASGGGGGSAAPSASGTPRVHGSLPPRPATGVGTSLPARTASGGTYRVRLDLILDPAQPAGRPAARARVRLIGVVLTVKAVRGALQGVNADREVAVVGSNSRIYRPVPIPIAGYAAFRRAGRRRPRWQRDGRGHLPAARRGQRVQGDVDGGGRPGAPVARALSTAR